MIRFQQHQCLCNNKGTEMDVKSKEAEGERQLDIEPAGKIHNYL